MILIKNEDINELSLNFRPVNIHDKIYEVLYERLQKAVEQFDKIINEDIQQFN